LSSRAAIETYRALYSTIKYAGGDDGVRAVLIVDVDRPSRSMVAENIAEAFARGDDACVLVDADLRSGPSERPGLAELLRDSTTTVGAEISDTGRARIGPGTAGSPDLLSGSGLAAAIASLRARYDYVIVSCPSLPRYGDAVAIAPHVDAAILVISAGVTGRDEAIQARDALERVGSRILGMVMVERPRRWF
jgi:Mrp family chromosome partitioning ATPase